MRRTGWRLLVIGGLSLSVAGCVTDASTELTRAPFDATTDLTDGTSNAIGDLVGATTDFTSSTTPGATFSKDALIRARKRTELFTARAYENLRVDISRGSGEYLHALATLAGVPSDHIDVFRSQMQDAYGTMFGEELPANESTSRVVEVAWSAGYGRR
ncbi:MAG TPA: DUF3015 family protein [Nitrospira sp.]|nr:DUF3015 family protein [Nitrospira sp.]